MWRAAWCGVLLLLLAACGPVTAFVDTKSYDVLSLTESFGKRFPCWEGGCTYLVKSTLCVTTTKECLEQKRFWVEPRAGSPETPARWVMVIGSTGAGVLDGPGDARVYRFYDATTGKRLACRNCAFSLEDRLAATEKIEFEWRDQGAQHGEAFLERTFQTRTVWSHNGDAMVAVLPGTTVGHVTLSLLNFDADGITWRDIGSPAMVEGGVANVSFSPDDRTVAWQSCTPRCALWTFDRPSGAHVQRDVHCNYSNAIDIGWEGSRATVHPTFAQCAAAPR